MSTTEGVKTALGGSERLIGSFMGLCAYACACACAHGHGQREGVRGRRTGERTAGQQETRTAGTAVQGTAGGQEGRTAGDSDGQETGRQGTRGQGQQETGTGGRRTAEREDSRTGGLKEDFHSHSHAVVVTSPLKQRRPTTLAAGLLVVLVQEEGDLSHKWSPSLHSGTCSGLMRTYLTHFLSGFSGSGAVLFEKWL